MRTPALLPLLAAAWLAPIAARAAAPTVAVLPFRDLSESGGRVGEAIRETVTTDLKQLGGVRVVERAELDRVLGEQHLQGAGELDPSTAARLGKLLGATLIATGAYQKVLPSVRLTARFVSVETGEIVGTAKVDGRATELLRLQDRITVALLRSAGLGAHATRMSEQSARRPMIKSLRTMELYGDALVADNDDKKAELLKLAIAEDASFSYAVQDLAALEKRMKQYEQRALASQDQRTRELLDQLRKESDPGKQALLAMQVLTNLAAARRHHTVIKIARTLATGPLASATLPSSPMRVDEMALFWTFSSENALKQRDALLRDGEEFLRRFPASMYFSSVKMLMDNAIREKRQVEDGRDKAAKEMAELRSDDRWDLCRIASRYSSHSQWLEAQRLFHACFAVGGADKVWLSSLITVDMSLGDWPAMKRDLQVMEREAPELYRQVGTSYAMGMPADD